MKFFRSRGRRCSLIGRRSRLELWLVFMKKMMFSLFNDFIVLSKVSVPLTVLTANRVSNFCDENEVLSAISSSPEGFHVAILVQVSISNQEVMAGEGKKKPPPSSCYQRLIMEPPSSPLHMLPRRFKSIH